MRWMMVVLLSVGLMGCEEFWDDMEDSSSSEGYESRKLAPGYTPCNDAPEPTNGVVCHPNQYCSSQHLSICRQGCLSDDNCTETQRCIKDVGADLGSCVSLEDLGESGEVERDDSNRGYTSCGSGSSKVECHPNQYCADTRWGECELGCLSDDNCASNQFCDKLAGEHVGSCLNL